MKRVSSPPSPPRRADREGASGVESSISSKHVLLSAQRHSLAMIPVALENNIAIAEDKVPTMLVTENARLSWIPFLETTPTAKAKTTFLATLFLPVNDAKEAEKISRSATIRSLSTDQLEVSVSGPAGGFRWRFQKGATGFELAN